jgi:ribosomal protein S12 methylthiotransferase accessory factor
LGCGAHLRARTAIRRAILEQGQTGPYHARLTAEGAAVPREASEVRSFLQHALYYAPAERSGAFAFLHAGGSAPCLYSSLGDDGANGLASCIELLSAAGLRVAAADITPPDVALLPLRVVRAVAPRLQPIHCGFGMERLDNPRLRALGRLNPNVHPFC